VFQGKFETADSITGEVEFSPLVGDLPSKHARSATRLGIVASSRSHGGNTDRPATAGRCRRRSGRYQTQSRISNAFHLHVFRGARSKSNSAVTKKKTSFELAPRDREFASHKPDLLS